MSEKMTVEALLDALDSVTWYNGLAEDVYAWKSLPVVHGTILCPAGVFPDDCRSSQLEVIWMICVELFGDYGISPRSGWIKDVKGFRDFIDRITTTEREDEEAETT